MKSLLPFSRRLLALVHKEACQISRDRWSLTVAILLPLFLLLLFGYGMSMDVKNIELAIVCPVHTPRANELIARFQSSDYFHVAVVPSVQQATERLIRHQSNAILYFPNDFDRKLLQGTLKLLLTQNAVNANQSRLAENYIRGIVNAYALQTAVTTGQMAEIPVTLAPRVWFNEANDSRYYLVPGVMVIIMTLIGALLTALVMAREYEHGNLECLFMSPVRPTEVLLAKAVNNFILGLIGLGLSLLAARYLFGVPVRGSIVVLIGVSGIYLLVALGLGLVVSSVTKNQFVACQLTLIVTFLPAYMLSGFIYDIDNQPWVVRMLSLIVPARYYVEFMQTIFLAGNIWDVIIRDALILSAFAVLFLHIARLKTPKSLE